MAISCFASAQIVECKQMNENAQTYILKSASSLLKINRNLKEMLKVVRKMDSPKHTKAETKEELLERLNEAGEEMYKISEKAVSYFPETEPATNQNGSKI